MVPGEGAVGRKQQSPIARNFRRRDLTNPWPNLEWSVLFFGEGALVAPVVCDSAVMSPGVPGPTDRQANDGNKLMKNLTMFCTVCSGVFGGPSFPPVCRCLSRPCEGSCELKNIPAGNSLLLVVCPG